MVPPEGQSLNVIFEELTEIGAQIKASELDIEQVFEELGL